VIEILGVRKTFGSVQAVRDVSFRADDGTVVGLLGPNGAGKTTTLRMLSGLMRPDAGTIRVDNADVVRDPIAVQKHMGLLPESRGLYPRLTPIEHIEYFGRLHGMEGHALSQRVRDLLELLDLKDLANRRVSGFSHGERTKVALARALVHRPHNIILDEPTQGLDVMSTRSVRDLVRKLRQDGCCVLFSSHIMQEVSALCDRIVMIAEGRVAADGTPDQLRSLAGQANLEDAFMILCRLEREKTS